MMTIRKLPLFDLLPFPAPGIDLELGATDLDRRVQTTLKRAGKCSITQTGVGRQTYLDLMERLVRKAISWRAVSGAVIDPIANKETGQTSPRFVASGAVLLHFGRVPDLREAIEQSMSYCCARLANAQADSPDFWMRELMTAWMLLESSAPPARRAEWERLLRSIEPESVYWQVARDGKTPADLHNWTVYAAAGEALRSLAGLAPQNGSAIWGQTFFDKYMPSQLQHFTADGMYRDPGDPLTYDMTTRLQFATPLAFGFETPMKPVLSELLRRGALAQLLYVSPEGHAPFGGRSSQIQMQECILAALGELEARRYHKSDPQLAGAFKRQAHLSVQSIQRWLIMSPHRSMKNGFPPDKMHGAEPYAGYAMYSMFAASCLGLAALYADDSIAESPAPTDIGGYVTEFAPAFHKIVAHVRGSHIEIDTRADLGYDATGLGRFMFAGIPMELGLATPFAVTTKFHLPADFMPSRPTAIGPAWLDRSGQWVYLAAQSDGLQSKLEVHDESADQVSCTVHWTLNNGTRTSVRYDLTAGRLRLSVNVQLATGAATAVRLIVPLLVTNGQEQSTIDLSPGLATVHYAGCAYRVTFPPQAATSFERDIANRNGIYRPFVLHFTENSGWIELQLLT